MPAARPAPRPKMAAARMAGCPADQQYAFDQGQQPAVITNMLLSAAARRRHEGDGAEHRAASRCRTRTQLMQRPVLANPELTSNVYIISAPTTQNAPCDRLITPVRGRPARIQRHHGENAALQQPADDDLDSEIHIIGQVGEPWSVARNDAARQSDIGAVWRTGMRAKNAFAPMLPAAAAKLIKRLRSEPGKGGKTMSSQLGTTIRRGAVMAAVFAAVSAVAPAAEPLNIPAVMAQTGSGAFIGTGEKQSLELAEKTINASGGIQGRPVAFCFL